jgi:hypothetical protein
MSDTSERVLVAVGHAWQCPSCRDKLLSDPEGILMRQGLTNDERELVLKIAPSDWITVGALAAALGVARCELEQAMQHPRCRLRHF